MLDECSPAGEILRFGLSGTSFPADRRCTHGVAPLPSWLNQNRPALAGESSTPYGINLPLGGQLARNFRALDSIGTTSLRCATQTGVRPGGSRARRVRPIRDREAVATIPLARGWVVGLERRAGAPSGPAVSQSRRPGLMSSETEIRPFRVDMPDEAIADLRRRIAATRWPGKELVTDRSQGVQLATLQELARYWATDYDWRACEAKLNALPQFKTEIDGVDIHFIHVKSQHENALPLIMTHGWPGSVIELLEVVGPLTDPTAHGGRAEDAFDLVLPSLPGYGFSAEPAEIGWNPGRIARCLGGADAPPRLHPLRRPGRRPRRLDHRRDGPPGTRGAARHPHELARDGAGRRRHASRNRAGTRGARADQDIQDERLRLLPGAGHAAADDRLRPAGFTRRPGGLDARPRHRRLLQDLPRLRRRTAVRESHPGPHPRQRHACTG